MVALGASLYAAYKGDRSKLGEAAKSSISQISVQEVTSKCFGTIHLHPDEETQSWVDRNLVIIERGEKIPVSKTDTLYPMRDEQEYVELSVTESVAADTDPRFVRIIWNGKLEFADPSLVRDTDEIEIEYSYDENQIMHCKFTRENDETIEVSLSMTDDEVDGDDPTKVEVL